MNDIWHDGTETPTGDESTHYLCVCKDSSGYESYRILIYLKKAFGGPRWMAEIPYEIFPGQKYSLLAIDEEIIRWIEIKEYAKDCSDSKRLINEIKQAINMETTL